MFTCCIKWSPVVNLDLFWKQAFSYNYIIWSKVSRSKVSWSKVSRSNVLAQSQLVKSQLVKCLGTKSIAHITSPNFAPIPSFGGNIVGSDILNNWHYHYVLAKQHSANELLAKWFRHQIIKLKVSFNQAVSPIRWWYQYKV